MLNRLAHTQTQSICPPCNDDCDQGRRCPARLSQSATNAPNAIDPWKEAPGLNGRNFDDLWVALNEESERRRRRMRTGVTLMVIAWALFWIVVVIGLWLAVPWVLERAFEAAELAPTIMKF